VLVSVVAVSLKKKQRRFIRVLTRR